VAVEEVEAAT
jgi:dynein heavy chain